MWVFHSGILACGIKCKTRCYSQRGLQVLHHTRYARLVWPLGTKKTSFLAPLGACTISRILSRPREASDSQPFIWDVCYQTPQAVLRLSTTRPCTQVGNLAVAPAMFP